MVPWTWLCETALVLAVMAPSAVSADAPTISATTRSSAALNSRAIAQVTVDPASLHLTGPDLCSTILVHGHLSDGGAVDLTSEATFRSLAPHVCYAARTGEVTGLTDGEGIIEITALGQTCRLAVSVSQSNVRPKFNFENDIVPILSRFGCNSSGCHGKAEGQNGFKLSVFGFDPAADYEALTMQSRGRRVFPAAPDRSLLLAKPSGGVPHGGGVRIAGNSREYSMLRDWIGAGMPFGSPQDPKVIGIQVTPRRRVLGTGATQRLRVVAKYSDGRDVDVTTLAKYQSNNEGMATVDVTGKISVGASPGQVAIMAGYMGAVAVFEALVPRNEVLGAYPNLPQNNFIDTLVDERLKQLRILPSEPADDAAFLRRVYLDVIGTLPTAAEARQFLSNSDVNRRQRLVEELLRRLEFADYWALKWSDVLRVDREKLGHAGAYAYYRWIRESLAKNKPLDQFARDLVAAEGPLADAPQGYFYQAVDKPGELASTISQVFLGIRIACADCHHHPFDRWSQTDYYGMQAFFTQLVRKPSSHGTMLLTTGDPPTHHPRSGELVLAHALGDSVVDRGSPGDRRPRLAAWLTSPDNPWFARNLANRLWAHFTGRGLVEPVDDVRASNPPSNPELLDALARNLIENRFDQRALIRTITESRVYQSSSRPNPTNQRDEQNYSRALWRRLDAEVLLDAVCQSTGVGEKFQGTPSGCRAIELWDNKLSHDFLRMFGRPTRQSACQCERTVEPSVAQVLHFLNSSAVHEKISHEAGKMAELAHCIKTDSRLVDELYLTCFSRFPQDDERRVAIEYLRSGGNTRRQNAEDLMWSLLNSLEFMFNH